MRSQPISTRAFAMLLLACMFAGNPVATRVALDHGVDVATAVSVRSLDTAAVVAMIVLLYRVPLALQSRHRKMLPLIALLVGVQSLCLFSAVAHIPMGLVLLAFNTYPVWAALAVWAIYGHRPERAVLIAMPVILLGLALALDVSGAASGLGLQDHWLSIGGSVTLGGLHWPEATAGCWGLALLTLLYGTAFTVMFTLLPRLGVVGSSPILNVEPVAALAMAWLWLGQSVSMIQVLARCWWWGR